MRKFPYSRLGEKKKCRQIAAVFCVVLIFTAILALGLRISNRSSPAPLHLDEHLRQSSKTSPILKDGCVLMAHSSTSDPLKSSPPFNDSDPEAFEKWGLQVQFYPLYTMAVNRGYARKHGLRFVYSDIKDLAADMNATGKPRHASWAKVALLRRELKCCCQWAWVLDSDSYLRMEGHTLSTHDWLSGITEEGYQKFQTCPDVKLHYQYHWTEHPSRLLEEGGGEQPTQLAALFPRNAGAGDRKWDRPQGSSHFLNAGVSLWRNSSLALEMVESWWGEDADNAPDPEFPLGFAHEQGTLNKVLFGRYKPHVVVVPHLELTGYHGRLVRHYWDKKNDYSVSQMRAAALTSLLLEEPKLWSSK